jgi:hypothetical protein
VNTRTTRNGRSAGTVADELNVVEAEIRAIEATGTPLADRLHQAEKELERCAEHYRAHGFAPMGTLPQEREHYRHLATVGAMMTIGKAALLQAEGERVTAAFQAAGGHGMSPGEKTERLVALNRRRRQCLARYEQSSRAQEGGGEIIVDGKRDASLFLLSDEDLAKEVAA